jgi:uncharacterized protein (DUF952 family)
VTLIHHLALQAEWDEAVARGGPYDRSTIGQSLAEVGFVHCSFDGQVEQTFALFYAHRDDVLVLTIDTDRLDVDVRVEDGFPHVYGPLPLDAVIDVRPHKVRFRRRRRGPTSRTR